MPDLTLTPLDDLTVLEVRGADALRFLNGQVSHDVLLLPVRRSLLTGLHNPQGRVLAVLRLFHLADDHVLAVVPQELAAAVRALLTRYVLRAKVRIDEGGATWRVYGLSGPDAAAAASTRLHMPMDASGLRQMIVAPRGEPLPDAEPATRDSWRLDDIAAGLPEVLTATSGQFVAQMLNLDVLDAISLTKGCYTGQEVIARAHYRGQVKRRLQRFVVEPEQPLAPGSRIGLPDGRSAIVVTAATDGQATQLLAVAPLHGAAAAAGETAAPDGLQVAAATLPLPYPLPV